jgi:hypothetical protein
VDWTDLTQDTVGRGTLEHEQRSFITDGEFLD